MNQEMERLFDQFCRVLTFRTHSVNTLHTAAASTSLAALAPPSNHNTHHHLVDDHSDSDDDEVPSLVDADSHNSTASTTSITEDEWSNHTTVSNPRKEKCISPEDFAIYQFGQNIIIDDERRSLSVSDSWLREHGNDAVRLLKEFEQFEMGRMGRTFEEMLTAVVNMHGSSQSGPSNANGVKQKRRKRLYSPPMNSANCVLRRSVKLRRNKRGDHSSEIVQENSSIETEQEVFDEEDDLDVEDDEHGVGSSDVGSDYTGDEGDENSVLSDEGEDDLDAEEDGEDEDDLDDDNDESSLGDREDRKWRESLKLFKMYAAKLFYERIVLAYREKLAMQMQKELIEEENAEKQTKKRRERQKHKKKEKKKTQNRLIKKQSKEQEEKVKQEQVEKQQQQEERQRRITEQQQKKIEEERQKIQEQMLEEIARQHLEQQKKMQEDRQRQLEREAEEEKKRREQEQKSKKKEKRKKKKSKKKTPAPTSTNLQSTNGASVHNYSPHSHQHSNGAHAQMAGRRMVHRPSHFAHHDSESLQNAHIHPTQQAPATKSYRAPWESQQSGFAQYPQQVSQQQSFGTAQQQTQNSASPKKPATIPTQRQPQQRPNANFQPYQQPMHFQQQPQRMYQGPPSHHSMSVPPPHMQQLLPQHMRPLPFGSNNSNHMMHHAPQSSPGGMPTNNGVNLGGQFAPSNSSQMGGGSTNESYQNTPRLDLHSWYNSSPFMNQQHMHNTQNSNGNSASEASFGSAGHQPTSTNQRVTPNRTPEQSVSTMGTFGSHMGGRGNSSSDKPLIGGGLDAGPNNSNGMPLFGGNSNLLLGGSGQNGNSSTVSSSPFAGFLSGDLSLSDPWSAPSIQSGGWEKTNFSAFKTDQK